MKVISIEPKKTIKKDDHELYLHILKCYGNGMMCDVTIWNQ